jgi:PAS domain S-box-containing protein
VQSVINIEIQRLEKLLNLCNDAIYIFNTDRKIAFWNKGAENQFGWTKEEATGQDIHELLQSQFPTPFREVELELYSTGCWEGEVHRTSRNGTEVVSTSRWILERDSERKPLSVLVINHDITKRKRAEDALWGAHNELQLLFDAIPSILIGMDSLGKISRWNQAAEDLFELRAADVHGKSLGNCGVRWLRENFESEILAQADAQTSKKIEVPFLKAGETRFLGTTLRRFKIDNDTIGILLIGADVTERITLESQLRQAQKLEAIGQLAAGIAHEINTPTQFIGDNTRFLKETWQEVGNVISAARAIRHEGETGTISQATLAGFDRACEDADLDYALDEVPQAIEHSLEGVQRVAKIVQSMKEFSHPGSEDKQPVNINRAIETTVTVARNEWKYVADVQMSLDQDLPPVPCYAAEFNQVILNLLVNAAHAISDVAAKNDSKAKGVISITTKREADCLEVRVGDTGAGIPERIRSRVFEPFFTTKEVGKGTGQGLALAHSVIVKKHGGTIWFESELGAGTTFIIRIPLSSAQD